MIVHIFRASASFKAVSYNTNKVDKDKGELMKVGNFGPVMAMQEQRPEDYRNYLEMLSATNKRVKYPSFHAVISCKGKEYDKDALTEIAELWLTAMGYGKQPYLIVFHKDTDNNHVHIVTSRVNRYGKKISDKYEKLRAVQQLNIVLGIDEKRNAKLDIEKALTYEFGTKAQFMMILESKGYVLKEKDGKLEVIKFGKRQDEIDLKLVDQKLGNYAPDINRKKQLKALFHKYAASNSTALTKGRTGYTSEFAAILKVRFGIDLLFHASGEKPPYGYTIIDHAQGNVFKGGEIMPLKELLDVRQIGAVNEPEKIRTKAGNGQCDYYAAMLKAALYNYPDLVQGLQHMGLVIIRNGDRFTLNDPGARIYIDTADLLNERDHQVMVEQFSQSYELQDEVYRQHVSMPGISLTDDIDDEAIHGRNRRRKQHPRTNSR